MHIGCSPFTHLVIREFKVKFTAAVNATAAAAANTRAKIHYKTRWAGKNFDFYSVIYVKFTAAVIATAAAAANTRAKIHYKTRGSGKHFDFHLGI